MTLSRRALPVALALTASGTGAAVPIAFVAPGLATLGAAIVLLVLAGSCGVVFGAVLAAGASDRGASRPGLVAGAIALPLGAILLMGGSLASAWPFMLAGELVIGAGQGLLLVMALVIAARSSGHRGRPWAVVAVLAAIVLGNPLAELLYGLGPPLVVVAAGMATAVAIVMALGQVGIPRDRVAAPRVVSSVLGGAVLALGVLCLLVAADETGTGFLVLLTPLREDIGAVDDSRRVLALFAGVAVAGGGWIGLPGLRGAWGAVVAAVGVGAIALLASAAALPLWMIVAMEDPTTPVWRLTPMATLAGLGLAAAWASAAHVVRAPATLGAVLAIAGLGVAALTPAEAGSVSSLTVALVVILVSIGAGAVSGALRTLLADAPLNRLGSTTAAGVVAALVGAQIGSTIGAQLSLRALPDPSPGAIVWVVAIIGLVAALLVPGRRREV